MSGQVNRNQYRHELRALAREYGSLRRGECRWLWRLRTKPNTAGPCWTVRIAPSWRQVLQRERDLEAGVRR